MANPFDLSNLSELFKQAKSMQERLSAVQQEVATRVAEGSAGGGMVTVRVNGRLEVLSLQIEPEVWKSGDREMLQDLVIAATNEALRAAQKMLAAEMSKLTGGLPIPGLG